MSVGESETVVCQAGESETESVSESETVMCQLVRVRQWCVRW